VVPETASAKEGPDAFRVVTPAGKVGWVRGQAAAAWWHDYDTPGRRGCRCITATAAMRYSRGLFRRLSTTTDQFPAGHTAWLLSAIAHWGPMVYYPPTPGLPGVVLTPAARGPRGWQFQWEVASPRMQSIVRLALDKGAVTSYGDSSAFPTGWALGGGLAAALLATLILGASRLPERLRPSRSWLSA
jgi:hypothetical protein